jgi:hypothetical protein
MGARLEPSGTGAAVDGARGFSGAVAGNDAFEPLLALITESTNDDESRRDAAEMLHGWDGGSASTSGYAAGHASARALLRDTRWDAPQAGPVPIPRRTGAARRE